MVTTAMAGVHLSVRRGPPGPRARLSRRAGRRHRPGVASEPGPVGHAATRRPAVVRGTARAPSAGRPGPELTGTRTREVTSQVEVRRRAYAAGAAPSRRIRPIGRVVHIARRARPQIGAGSTAARTWPRAAHRRDGAWTDCHCAGWPTRARRPRPERRRPAVGGPLRAARSPVLVALDALVAPTCPAAAGGRRSAAAGRTAPDGAGPPPGRHSSGAGYAWPLWPPPGGRRAVRGADAPVRSGPPRRRSRRRPGGRRCSPPRRARSCSPACSRAAGGVGPARGRAADHLRTAWSPAVAGGRGRGERRRARPARPGSRGCPAACLHWGVRRDRLELPRSARCC